MQQLPGVSYGMNHQPIYNPMQSKAPAPPGPGLYPSGAYQPIPPVSSYQPGQPPTSYPAPHGQPLMTRPPMGVPPSNTPPQSASPGPRPSLARATPPPPAAFSSSYYPNPQQPQPMAPSWQYNTAPPPMGPPTSTSTPPRGPVANHVNPSSSSTVPPPPLSSAAYSSGPGMPPTSLQGYNHPGRSTKAPLKAKHVTLAVNAQFNFIFTSGME